jgi:hypothetical protein
MNLEELRVLLEPTMLTGSRIVLGIAPIVDLCFVPLLILASKLYERQQALVLQSEEPNSALQRKLCTVKLEELGEAKVYQCTNHLVSGHDCLEHDWKDD